MPPTAATPLSPELERQFAAVRERRNLTRVTDELEGVPLSALPDNVYGYTYSPVNESTPLFAKRAFQCFEVHKLEAGVVHLLGFVTPQEAELFHAGQESLDLRLYPEPKDNSTTLIEVPLERVAKAKPVSRSDGNYMPLQLDPVL
jgi:hypothetical protein